MLVNPRECMFCHADLPPRPDEPANLAFLAHVERSPGCNDAYEAWMQHMQSDFKGD